MDKKSLKEILIETATKAIRQHVAYGAVSTVLHTRKLIQAHGGNESMSESKTRNKGTKEQRNKETQGINFDLKFHLFIACCPTAGRYK